MNTINRNFGIELEIADISISQTVEALRNAGIRVEAEGYNHYTKSHWKVVTDASVSNGHEVVSPILRGEAGLAEAEKVARTLEEAGAKVNKTCGLHIHFESRDLNVNEVRTIAQRYASYEAEIDAFMPASRRLCCLSTNRQQGGKSPPAPDALLKNPLDGRMVPRLLFLILTRPYKEISMRYRYADGFEFEANNAREVCEALWHSMHFQFYDTLEEWLRQNAEHCQRWNGKTYSASSPEAHVDDLLRHGMLITLPASPMHSE